MGLGEGLGFSLEFGGLQGLGLVWVSGFCSNWVRSSGLVWVLRLGEKFGLSLDFGTLQ